MRRAWEGGGDSVALCESLQHSNGNPIRTRLPVDLPFPMPEAFSEIPPPTLRRKSFCFICHRNPSRVKCWPHWNSSHGQPSSGPLPTPREWVGQGRGKKYEAFSSQAPSSGWSKIWERGTLMPGVTGTERGRRSLGSITSLSLQPKCLVFPLKRMGSPSMKLDRAVVF